MTEYIELADVLNEIQNVVNKYGLVVAGYETNVYDEDNTEIGTTCIHLMEQDCGMVKLTDIE
ncbi:hypothetical protein [Lachnospira multipara]|uniref:Uncharacterized protein n=1 Tax=Lachnospira multipara TaxID=28051 RepID=A0A1H5VUY9_9FIRM|nr:hypothetical protein [Lachnospira multipara]SEF90953.1 hypothetical protein SAMN05216537_112109 [Lachnospira multipara]